MSLAGEPAGLARRLGLADAVVMGLGSMLGAGVFAAVAPAAEAAGSGLLIGLVIAAAVAFCNATSSAQLAAASPTSGGTYVYGRERLGPFWGYVAGWGFVVGKTASCAAVALTFGSYTAPDLARPLAVAAVVVLTAANYRGINKTAAVARILVAAVLLALAVVVIAALGGGRSRLDNLGPVTSAGGVLRSAGLLFFAFAGYARIATLGEEVVDPERTIPRAIPAALGAALGVYAAVSASALLALGPQRLARERMPLAAAVEAGRFSWMSPAVRAGAVLATLAVLLSLLVGVSRTAFAMARHGDMPGWLDAVHPRHRVPHRAELAVAAVTCAVVVTADVRGAIGFSSFTVLVYYALTNAAAWTLPAPRRRWPRALSVAGLGGCLVLAFSLPLGSLAAGAVVIGVGAGAWLVRRRHAG